MSRSDELTSGDETASIVWGSIWSCFTMTTFEKKKRFSYFDVKANMELGAGISDKPECSVMFLANFKRCPITCGMSGQGQIAAHVQSGKGDLRHLRKCAMFKTMGYSPGFCSKSANFGPLRIHPKSTQQSPKQFWIHLQALTRKFSPENLTLLPCSSANLYGCMGVRCHFTVSSKTWPQSLPVCYTIYCLNDVQYEGSGTIDASCSDFRLLGATTETTQTGKWKARTSTYFCEPFWWNKVVKYR